MPLPPVSTCADKPSRAGALPPEQRRTAIVEATLPLLLERGSSVTTRQIAEAAGIAEGTIFRVFKDKDAVIEAVLERAFDTEPTERAITAIDRDQPFDRQLTAAVDIMQRRHDDIWRLITSLGGLAALGGGPKPPSELVALTALFEPQRDQLCHDPATAARELRALTLAVSHAALHGDEPMSPAEVVSLLLDGIRRRSGPDASVGGSPC